MIKTREVKFTECDGCGYSINTDNYFTTLELGYKQGNAKGKIPFHFHASTDEHDCLRYWLTSEHVFRRSLKERTIPTVVEEHIIKTTAAFQRKVA